MHGSISVEKKHNDLRYHCSMQAPQDWVISKDDIYMNYQIFLRICILNIVIRRLYKK